jgi:hypothetical protein
MVDTVTNAGAAQARELLKEMYRQVADISHKLETAEGRHRRTSLRGAMQDHRQLSCLRRELYEAHRLIDGLHRRYPETIGASAHAAEVASQVS